VPRKKRKDIFGHKVHEEEKRQKRKIQTTKAQRHEGTQRTEEEMT
jgi:hypothetical protein